MNFLRDLSLAYKTPLRICVLVVCTALLVTGVLVLRERDALRQDLVQHSAALARVLANTLTDPIVHDDAWRVYEIISAPYHVEADGAAARPEVVLVLDAQHRVYVSTRPAEYPMLGNPAHIDPEYADVQQQVADADRSEPTAIVGRGSGKLYLALPVLADGVELGTLLMVYAGEVFAPRLAALQRRAALVTALVLAVLLPAGWYWGRRVAQPLVDLAGAMGQVGPHVPAALPYVHRYRGRDEIGRLGIEFQRMLAGLREKEELERQMIASDRLAAIGRLAAGIAHEINNPLGGMLNAISTFRRHGQGDALTQRTLSLIERGLGQIRETVAALLVEARVESHALTYQDVEDTRTLVMADAQAKALVLEWHNGIDAPLELPSTPTRQILINLLLNAVQAAPAGGRVVCRSAREPDALRIVVANEGPPIPPEVLPTLFEPFPLQSSERHGLGLWVTYQIVQQLGGEIRAASDAGLTTFTVVLPLAPRHESQDKPAPVPG